MSYGTVQAEKLTTESGYSLGAGNASSFKNRIINGDMVISQRSGTSSVSVNGDNIVNPDRWTSTEIGDGAFTVQQVTDAPAGFTNSLRVTTTTVQTGTLNAVTRQSIEGFNIADLGWGTASAKSVTLSFWTKSSLTGSFGGAIRNDAGDRAYPFSYTINSANTWEQKTITIPGDTTGTWATNNGTGIVIWFSHGTSSTGTANAWVGANVRAPTGSVFIIQTLSATWQITGAQFEVGTVATSWDFRSIGTELALCQRYALKVGGAGNDQYSQGTGLYADANQINFGPIPVPVTLRASVSLTTYGTPIVKQNGGAVTGWAPTISSTEPTGPFIRMSKTSHGLTANSVTNLNFPSTSDYFIISAEL